MVHQGCRHKVLKSSWENFTHVALLQMLSLDIFLSCSHCHCLPMFHPLVQQKCRVQFLKESGLEIISWCSPAPKVGFWILFLSYALCHCLTSAFHKCNRNTGTRPLSAKGEWLRNPPWSATSPQMDFWILFLSHNFHHLLSKIWPLGRHKHRDQLLKESFWETHQWSYPALHMGFCILFLFHILHHCLHNFHPLVQQKHRDQLLLECSWDIFHWMSYAAQVGFGYFYFLTSSTIAFPNQSPGVAKKYKDQL